MSTLSLLQQRAIDRQKENLVPRAEKLLNDVHVTAMEKFGHSQFRNLLAVANETESPAVVTNFIRYQMGRDNHKKNWAKEVDGTTLGKEMILEIDGGVIQRALDSIDGLEGELVQLAKIELIRHFIGFVSRYLKYLELDKKTGTGQGKEKK